MKKDIHPKYYPDAVVKCACGNEFRVGSTKPEIRVEICSKCHPFYTGEAKFIDTEGRIEKFKKKYAEFYKKQEENK
jgi:large subunit ribosomal protein L31